MHRGKPWEINCIQCPLSFIHPPSRHPEIIFERKKNVFDKKRFLMEMEDTLRKKIKITNFSGVRPLKMGSFFF